jgi:uncharacterized membrane protein
VTQLVLGIVVFIGLHSISIVAEDWRNRVVARLGRGAWQAVYSILSLVGLVLIVRGYAAARLDPVILYTPALWMRHSAMLLMMFVFPLLLATYLPGRIKTAFKHPTLVAVKTWSVAHLLANGGLHDVILFGAFLAWAVVDRISYRYRAPRPSRAFPPSRWSDAITIVGGLALYGVFLRGGHEWLTGVPLPWFLS